MNDGKPVNPRKAVSVVSGPHAFLPKYLPIVSEDM